MKNGLYLVLNGKGSVLAGCASNGSLTECRGLVSKAKKKLKEFDDGTFYLESGSRKDKVFLLACSRGKSIVYEVYSIGKLKIKRCGSEVEENTLLDIIRKRSGKKCADIEQVVADAGHFGIKKATARRIVTELLRKGIIYEKEYNKIRVHPMAKELRSRRGW